MTTTAEMSQPPRRVALLGPQHECQTLRGALDQLGAKGPMVLASAGWEERESETGALEEHLGQDVVSLGLWPAAEDVFRADPSVREILFRRFDRMRELGGIYRVRLAAELEALRELLRRTDPGNPDDLVGPALGPAFDSLIALDAHHTARVHELNQEIFEEACAKGEVQRVRDELRPTLEGAGTLLVAGGHVGILYNRMRLFGVLDSLSPAAPVVGWSGGAMVLTERILLFHDSPPQGAGDAEIYGPGFGIAKGVVCLPHASRRLKLEDRARVALLARRLAPAQVAALDDGQSVLQESVFSDADAHEAGGWRLQQGARELQVSGEVLEPDLATKGVPA